MGSDQKQSDGPDIPPRLLHAALEEARCGCHMQHYRCSRAIAWQTQGAIMTRRLSEHENAPGQKVHKVADAVLLPLPHEALRFVDIADKPI